MTDKQISSLEIACGNTSGAKAASEQVFNLINELEKELEDNSGNANSKVMKTIEAIRYASFSAASMNAEAKYVLEELLKSQNIITE